MRKFGTPGPQSHSMKSVSKNEVKKKRKVGMLTESVT
jgi:hypothetical protein